MPPGMPLPGEREALDPDDYSGGFAVWSGTSFSAPLLAAHDRPGAAGGGGERAACSLTPWGAAATEPRAGRPDGHGLAGLTGWTTARPSRCGLASRTAARGSRDLLSAAREGSEDALGQIVTELSPLLWQVARAAGLSPGDAEDVLQTVWMRLLTHLDGIHDVGGAHRLAGHHHQAGSVAGARRGAQAASRGPGTVRRAARPGARVGGAGHHRGSAAALWAAIGQLSPRCQELLRIIAFVPRPDYAAVAAELGMPVGSIGPTRGRCLAKLRALLAGDPEGSSQ